jgi:hypothetical protein
MFQENATIENTKCSSENKKTNEQQTSAVADKAKRHSEKPSAAAIGEKLLLSMASAAADGAKRRSEKASATAIDDKKLSDGLSATADRKS